MTVTYFNDDGDDNQNDDSVDYDRLENLFNDTHLPRGDDEQNDDSSSNREDGEAVYKIW